MGRVPRWAVYSSPYTIEPLSLSCLSPTIPNMYSPAIESSKIEWKQMALYNVHDSLNIQPDNYLLQAVDIVEAMVIPKGRRTEYDYASSVDTVRRACGDKSPGWWWKMSGFKTKTSVINSCPDLLHKRVRVYLDGKKPWYPWTAALKGELVKERKVVAEDTRLFLVGPIEHLIAMYMIFGALCDAIYANAASHPIKVGLCKQYGFWKRAIFDQLGEKNYVIDGEKYDVSLVPVLMWYGGEILRRNCCNPEVGRQLILESIYSVVVLGRGHVTRKNGGNASGGFLTLILNCLCQCLLIVRANLIHCMCTPGKDLLLKVVGDDGCYTPKNCKLTIEQIIAAFADFNVKLKDVQVCSAEDVQFCGVSFRDGVLCPRNDKFYCSLFWARHKSPLLRMQRLCALFHELYEDPRGPPVLLYILAFQRKYKVPIYVASLAKLLYLSYGAVDRNKLSALKSCYQAALDNNAFASSSTSPSF